MGGKRESLELEHVDIAKLMHKHKELAFLLMIFHMFFVGFYIEIFLKMVKYKSLFRNYQKTFNDINCFTLLQMNGLKKIKKLSV